MRSNLCRIVGLLSVLLLAASLGSFGYGERNFFPGGFVWSSTLSAICPASKLFQTCSFFLEDVSIQSVELVVLFEYMVMVHFFAASYFT